MEEKKKRRGYKTQTQQNEANRRYLANNPEAKEKIKKSGYKSKAKKFIKEMANLTELEELEILIKNKKGVVKMLEKLKKEFIGNYDESNLALAHSINFYFRDRKIEYKGLEVQEDYIELVLNKKERYIFELELKDGFYEITDVKKRG